MTVRELLYFIVDNKVDIEAVLFFENKTDGEYTDIGSARYDEKNTELTLEVY